MMGWLIMFFILLIVFPPFAILMLFIGLFAKVFGSSNKQG